MSTLRDFPTTRTYNVGWDLESATRADYQAIHDALFRLDPGVELPLASQAVVQAPSADRIEAVVKAATNRIKAIMITQVGSDNRVYGTNSKRLPQPPSSLRGALDRWLKPPFTG